MGLSASQGRLLLLTARRSDLELRAQSISQKRLAISQELEGISLDYENATSNRQMKMSLYLNGNADTSENVQRISNLTYDVLISGTLQQFSASQSGIGTRSGYMSPEYTSNSAYRLVDADGAIVVSSEEEIPGYTVTTSYESASNLKDKDGNVISENLFQTGTKNVDGSYSNSKLYVVPNGEALTQFFEKNKNANLDSCSINIDVESGIIAAVDKETNTTKYFGLNGLECTDTTLITNFKGKPGTLVGSTEQVPSTTVCSASNVNIVPVGNDGKYTVMDGNTVVARYVVDKTLGYGSTDVNGAKDGPNYLQDCLRNGKYLIEKGQVSEEDGKIRWSSIAWDAITNITDTYYTEDDDKAKAKYDRLQNQLQAQDKKLELELNNIEAQRSAVTTEIESVEKVRDENTESTFNTFA